MKNTTGASQIFAVLIADGEPISQRQLTEKIDGEIVTRHFVTSTAKTFEVKIGTESQELYTLRLKPKEFSGGRTGYAHRAPQVRANLVRQDTPDVYGVTIAYALPDAPVSLSWAKVQHSASSRHKPQNSTQDTFTPMPSPKPTKARRVITGKDVDNATEAF